MAVSTERDPVALRADLAAWLGYADRRERRRGRRGQHPGPVRLLERDAALRGHLGRGGPPARDPGRAHRPHRLPGHGLRRPGAGDAGAARRGLGARAGGAVVRGGPDRARRPVRVHAPRRRRGARPDAPATTPTAGCRRSRPTGSARCGRAASTRWRASTSSTAPRSGSAGSTAVDAAPSSSSSTSSTARFACGDVPYPAVDRAFEHPRGDRPAAPPTGPRSAGATPGIGNMIFGDDQRVAAVLDWEMVTAGDPVQDLAWYLAARPSTTSMAFERAAPARRSRRARSPSPAGRRRAGTRPSTSSGTSCSARDPLRLDHGPGDGAARPARASCPEPTGDAFDQTGTRLLEQMLDERT